MRRWGVAVALVLGVGFAATAGATVTSSVTRYDASGTVLLNGAKIFPIVLSKGPPRGGTTPLGADALNEVIGAGVNFFKVGPPLTLWTSADIDDAKLWNQAVVLRGAYTWINLDTLSKAPSGSSTDALLHQVITTLKSDPIGSPGIGMWKGADEPWWNGIPVTSLQHAYCLATSRGSLSWCANETPLDSDHLWVTIQAPRGTASDLAPYSAVTDTHGVDKYPIGIKVTNPDLHQVGLWTSTIASITPSHSVWTTLQICFSGSVDEDGNFVLPTKTQERYMIYDAIINGARNLNFYGGNIESCWNSTDAALGWNWTFWDTVLKSLVQEISASSQLAPALVNAASNQVLPTSDSTTQAISRQGATSSDVWAIAARSGSGTQAVTISGLPSTITSGTVYTEGRSVSVTNGSFTDNFSQWAVHVYRFSTIPPPAPTISSFTPTSGPAGTTVTISGTNFSDATTVAFNGSSATYTVNSDTQITATVRSGATSGPISVTTAGGTATSTTYFTVTAAPPTISSFSPSRGRVGTSVTITGTNFAGATSVAFKGVAARYTVNSNTQITAIVPSGATSGPITVTTPAGTATSSKSFTVR